MQLGWIDYSKEDRQKVLSVIDLLSEEGTLDELGVANIRDGFSELFFPGTSTIQTRAKYFLIVPYILKSLAHQSDLNAETLRIQLDDMERKCGEILLAQNAAGTIGSIKLRSNEWVQRAPSSIYWAGIRKYGIFTNASLSINEYLQAICVMNQRKKGLKEVGIKVMDPDNLQDDSDAGSGISVTFWKLPEHSVDWMTDLSMELSAQEALFLKNQIATAQPETLLAYILKHNFKFLPELSHFADLSGKGILPHFSEQIQSDVLMACSFSTFFYGAIIRYNVILSQGRNQEANTLWQRFTSNIEENASIDIPAIFSRLSIFNPRLKHFLLEIQRHMLAAELDALDGAIRRREIQLKGESRAKLNQAGHFDADQWVGGHQLEYRFQNAMSIVRDIFSGLEYV